MGNRVKKTRTCQKVEKNEFKASLSEAELVDMLGVSGIDTSQRMVLEPRLLLDAAGAETADVIVDQVALEQVENWQNPVAEDEITAIVRAISEVDDAQQAEQVFRNEIVFIDSNIDDIETLLAGIGPSIEVVILDPDTDGVEQIANVLEGREDVDGIHIIAHGRPGTLDLGTAKLTEASIANKHADEIAIIREALSDDADLLIYGCNFGGQARGASAVVSVVRVFGQIVA